MSICVPLCLSLSVCLPHPLCDNKSVSGLLHSFACRELENPIKWVFFAQVCVCMCIKIIFVDLKSSFVLLKSPAEPNAVKTTVLPNKEEWALKKRRFCPSKLFFRLNIGQYLISTEQCYCAWAGVNFKLKITLDILSCNIFWNKWAFQVHKDSAFFCVP